MKIDWNGFLDEVVKPERATHESCAWLFSERPFSPTDIVHVCEVMNVGLKTEGYCIGNSFAPDPKDFARIKKLAKEDQFTRIGNIHTHLVTGSSTETLEIQSHPSAADLKFARRFNDVIRGIIVVSFPEPGKDGTIHSVIWHDQYGNNLDLDLE